MAHKIRPFNTKKRSREYVREFVKELEEKLEDYPEYENDFLFRGMATGDIVLILDPKRFYIPSTARRGGIVSLANLLCPSNVVTEQISCKKVGHLRSTPAKDIGGSGLMYGGYIGESPWEACASDWKFLCQDGEERFMMNYDVGKGYVFLPHPDLLDKFLEGLQKIPKKRLKRGIESQIRKYFESLE